MSGPYTTVEIRQGIFRIDGPVIGEFLVASDDLAGRIVRAVNAAYAAGREGVRAETLEEAAQLAEGWVNDTRWEANIRLGARYAAAKIRSILAQTDKEQI